VPGGSRTWGHPLTRTKIRPLKSEARLLMGFRPKARNIEGPGVAAVVRLRPSHSLDLRPVAGSEFEAAQIQSVTPRLGRSRNADTASLPDCARSTAKP
jgi:hypothetical protein